MAEVLFRFDIGVGERDGAGAGNERNGERRFESGFIETRLRDRGESAADACYRLKESGMYEGLSGVAWRTAEEVSIFLPEH